MGVAVVADFMAFGDRTAQDLRVERGALADDKERGLDVAGPQNLEQARGVGRVRTVIKGDGDIFPGNLHL